MKGFGYLVKEGLRNVWSNRIMSIASVCVLISCLILTSAALLFSINVAAVVDSVGQSNETTVYLKNDVSELEAVYIGKDILRINNVTSADFLSKEDALEKFRNQLGDELFEQIDESGNPLPDAYVVAMNDLSLYEQTIADIKAIEGVDSVNSRQDTALMLTNLSRIVNLVSFGVVLALVIISLFIIANTIRATMYSRRYEISIMKSVGATNAFVRMPFLVEGMIIGFVSALISTAGISLLYEGVMSAVTNIIPFDFIPLSQVILPVALAFIAAGVIIGMLGSTLSMRKYLKLEGNEILGW